MKHLSLTHQSNKAVVIISPGFQVVMQAISRNPGLSAAKIAAQIGISKASVERILRSLKEKKYIRREGSTRGRWIIIRTV